MFTCLHLQIMPSGYFLIHPKVIGVTPDEMHMMQTGAMAEDRRTKIFSMMKKEVVRFQNMETVGTA